MVLLLLLLDIIVVTCIAMMELRTTWTSIFIKALTTRSITRVGLVDSEWIHLRVLRPLMPVGEGVLLDVRCVRVGTLLG